jgi:thiol-disulfide isomerase/thioredoxin
MNKIFIGIIALVFVSCSTTKPHSSPDYTVVPDKKTKVLKGIINRQILESDTTFKWFKENMKWGFADSGAVAAFKQYGNNFKMIIFGGTWCSDTKNLLPVFYRLVDKSGYNEKNITLVAVDRNKQTIRHLNKKYHITNVPTFIVLQNGKEVGRVVEYGKYNAIDKELGEIVMNTIARK